MKIIERLASSAVFWGAWVVLPFIMEIIPSLGSVLVLLKRWHDSRHTAKPILYPEISIIVPVYNSSGTLEACIRSINDSEYANEKIRVFLVNNQGSDDSFSVFNRCQEMFPDLHMQWLNAKQGKSRALNLALYNSEGKYIIHIDSDGVLEPAALSRLVDKFEEDPSVNCMTGVVMVNPKLVEEYPHGISRAFRKLEFLEYAQAFLAGRNYASELDSIYTLSGAFSAFRKSAILKSRLYNTDTICEDTQITFQMRYIQKEKIKLAEHSIFFVDPIESVNKLYVQRQRWQRGSLEVARMFMNEDQLRTSKIISDVNVRSLMYDHTFAFPRMIWYLALICLMFVGYSGRTVLLAALVLMTMYTVCGYLYFFSIRGFLSDFKEIRQYYSRQWYLIPFLPLFNLIVFFMRLAGIINSINTDSAWRTRDLTQEGDAVREIVQEDLVAPRGVAERLRNLVNGDPETMYAPRTREQKLRGSFWRYFAGVIALLFSVTLAAACHWGTSSFNVSLNEIVNTLMGPLAGVGGDTVTVALRSCLPPVLGVVGMIVLFLVIDRLWTRRIQDLPKGLAREKRTKWILRLRCLVSVCVCASLIGSLVYANACYDVVGYAASKLSYSSLYEEYFVDPDSVAITSEGETKNLIYIYVESLETTYASAEDGGFQSVNYMPNLTRLAEENVSFSNTEHSLGGFYSSYGSTWTMAALYSTSSGVHFALPLSDSDLSSVNTYASGLTTIGDVLKERGYQNEFLCGSDANFANRGKFFRQHGSYEVFDYYTAIEKGYIPKGYYQWWGFEDLFLYQIARDELTRLSQGGKPFNLTMLTADTHFPDGYICTRCGNDYGETAANVVSCTDRQLGEFIDWCKEQPFYENTVIVITGDHPRMDAVLVEGVPWESRTVYDCLINPEMDGPAAETNRLSITLDMFPTVLSAMGFDIEGDRLGLGTNLFSNRRTLAEEIGIDRLQQELQQNSDFYVATFAPELLGSTG